MGFSNPFLVLFQLSYENKIKLEKLIKPRVRTPHSHVRQVICSELEVKGGCYILFLCLMRRWPLYCTETYNYALKIALKIKTSLPLQL